MTPSWRRSSHVVRPVERGERGRGRVVMIVSGWRERRARRECRKGRRWYGWEAVGG